MSRFAYAAADARIALTRRGEMPFCTSLRNLVCCGGSSNWIVFRRKSGKGKMKGTCRAPVRNGSRTKRGLVSTSRHAWFRCTTQTLPP